jgi:hypothetical protein
LFAAAWICGEYRQYLFLNFFRHLHDDEIINLLDLLSIYKSKSSSTQTIIITSFLKIYFKFSETTGVIPETLLELTKKWISNLSNFQYSNDLKVQHFVLFY